MFSIITATMRDSFQDRVFKNYTRQSYPTKELIVVLNKDNMDIEEWKKRAKEYPNVRIFQLNQGISLGECLNFAASKCQYPYIAKFDDDDYYAPNYLRDAERILAKQPDIGILGKNAYYIFLENEQQLLYSDGRTMDYVDWVAGPTLIFRHDLWEQVKFRDRTAGEDYFFLHDALERGYNVYAGKQYNFVLMRRNAPDHTWQQSGADFKQQAVTVDCAGDFRSYIAR